MEMSKFFIYLAVSALVTYSIRMLPFVLFKKKITNIFVLSFLYYIPYAVLAVMTIPAIFTSTSGWISAAAATVVAILLAYFEKSLLTVAVISCITVFVIERLL